MAVAGKRVFIYGNFVDKEERARRGANPAPRPPTIAVEILREFSATELVGRVYILTGGRNWQPASPDGIRNYTWFQTYYQGYREAQHKRNHGRLYFETQEKDHWGVLYLRQESDESGAYVAVAMQQE
jgi:hypothetical protein